MMRKEQLNIYRERIRRFIDDLKRDLWSDDLLLQAEAAITDQPVRFQDRHRLYYRPIAEGEVWAEKWQSAWFRLSGRIPERWAGKPVVARINLFGECLVFDAAGEPKRGLSGNCAFVPAYAREIYPVTDCAVAGEKIELHLEAAASNLFGILREERPGKHCRNPEGRFAPTADIMRLAVDRVEMRQFLAEMAFVDNWINLYDPTDYRYAQMVKIVGEAIQAFGCTADAVAGRRILQRILERKADASALRTTAVGHAHIDTGWLWPVAETVRKCGRTFANQLDLLARYPDYVFGASQPQHYQFVKEHYPTLYARIKEYVAAGRWELQGGMWVEADCNLPDGESLIRQFLHGKNFFRDEFGIEVKTLWLPDVFGYSAAMPQIIRKSRCDYFLTQKLSWNQTNAFPHHTFIWRGIDGSEVLTHFPPEGNYNSAMQPEILGKTQNIFRENHFVDEFLTLFGIGDGGGGPKEEFIENGRRMQDLEGCPRVRFGRSDEFFQRLEGSRSDLAVWEGELYFELHRGTLTTQARVKRANRKLEQLLQSLEFAFAALPPDAWPQAEFDRLWKTLLINQFHDILPGSSIELVYANAAREYREMFELCHLLQVRLGRRLLRPDENALTLFNSLSVPWRGNLVLPSAWRGFTVVDASGGQLPCQLGENDQQVRLEIPPGMFLTLQRGRKDDIPAAGTDQLELVLENEEIRYEFDENARLLRAFDKRSCREWLRADSPGNRLSLYIDEPNASDAWDIDIFYEEQLVDTARSAGQVRTWHGPIGGRLQFELQVGTSIIRQTISLTAGSRRLDFQTAVDWRETHRMLRVAFPVEVCSDTAAFDIQYGFVRRPTHRNTSWDLARFETAGQRYADLSDDCGGVALLNDSKYGYKVSGHTLDLNLLRSPRHPDFHADCGSHEFTYSLLPHNGGFVESEVMAEAAQLNRQPLQWAGYAAPENAVLPCRLEGDGVKLAVLKKAEKSDQWILRLVETHGRHSHCRLTALPEYRRLIATDLLEWENLSARKLDGAIELNLSPFEIATFKLCR